MFLKSLVSNILKGARIALVYGAGISALTPTGKDDRVVQYANDTFSKIADLIVTSQTFREVLSLNGPQALEGIQPLVTQLILQSELLVGKEIADQDKFAAAVKGIASNLVDLLNSVKQK